MVQALGASRCHPSQAGLEPTPAQHGASGSTCSLQSPLGRVSPILCLLADTVWWGSETSRGFRSKWDRSRHCQTPARKLQPRCLGGRQGTGSSAQP